MSTDKDEKLSKFDVWFYQQISTAMKLDGVPVPLGTELMYGFESADGNHFNRLLDILEAAFAAGQKAGPD